MSEGGPLLWLVAALAHADPCGPLDLSVADAVMRGDAEGDRAGHSVAFAGDVTGDGRSDVLVGAVGHEGRGAAFLVTSPRTGALSSIGRALSGGQAGAQAGHAVAGAGDLDGDTFADFVVGAPAAGAAGAEDGAVYRFDGPLVLGGSLSSALGEVSGAGGGGLLGIALAGVGDVGGSSFDDLALGAPATDDDAGAVYLFHGPVLGALDLDERAAVLTGASPGDRAGWSLSAGDVTGDAASDVIVGAPGAGAAYVVAAPITRDRALDDAVRLRGEGRFGWSVAAVGDVDGDGIGDLLVGAPSDGEGGTARLFRGPVTDDAAPAAVLVGAPGAEAGTSVAAAGDVNGDGFADLLIGGPGADTAWLVLGPVWGEVPLSRADGVFTGAGAGASVAGGQDVDRDGLPDLLVGAPSARTDDVVTGAAYLVLGAACPPVTDADRDGVDAADDCNDRDPARSPALDEIACNGVDDDCDGDVDEGAPCDDTGATDTGHPDGYGVLGCERRGAGGTFALLLPLLLRRRR